MDFKTILNKDAETAPQAQPPPPPPQRFSPAVHSSPQSFHHPPPPGSYGSPTAHHHAQAQHAHQYPQNDYFPAVTPTSRSSRSAPTPYGRPSQSPYPPLPPGYNSQPQHSQSHPSASPSTASTPGHAAHSLRESPMSASSYSHPSQFHHAAPPSHPGTPLGPPLNYNRSSGPVMREPVSPYAHQRTLSGASYGAPSTTPMSGARVPPASSPGNYNAQSPQVERNGSDYAYQRERERTVSVSPKTMVPSRQQSMESRHLSQEFDPLHSTPAPAPTIQSILQPSTPHLPMAQAPLQHRPSSIHSSTAQSSPELLTKPLPNSVPNHSAPRMPPQQSAPQRLSQPTVEDSTTTLARKRKRGDPIPIWARKARDVPPEQREIRKPPPLRSGTPVKQETVKLEPNGHPVSNHVVPEPLKFGPLESCISTIPPYDALTRKISDFLWESVVENNLIEVGQPGGAPSPHGQLEVEAKLGVLIDQTTGSRLDLPVVTETVLDKGRLRLGFRSDMTEAHHKKLNLYLNDACLSRKDDPPAGRIKYKHKREIDTFYLLDEMGFHSLPPAALRVMDPSRKSRVRVTTDAQTGEVLAKVVKHRLADLDIYSPNTAFDYRISVNIEMNYTGPVENLVEAREGRMRVGRKKDRMSYEHQSYFIDLTQVTPLDGEPLKTHELEIEVSTEDLKREGQKARDGLPNVYEEQVVKGFINNVRVLARVVERQG